MKQRIATFVGVLLITFVLLLPRPLPVDPPPPYGRLRPYPTATPTTAPIVHPCYKPDLYCIEGNK